MIMMRFTFALVIVFALSWIPLVGAFHYETALTIALAGAILVPICCGHRKLQNKDPEPLAQHAHWRHALRIAVTFWIASTAVCALTACIKQEILCNFWQGMTYQCLIALPANILAALTWGWSVQRSKYLWIHLSIYIGCIAVDLGWTFFALYHWPSLIAFGQFFGFFAGSIYDEAIHITQALITYRMGTLFLCLMLILGQNPKNSSFKNYLLPFIGLSVAIGCHAWMAFNGTTTPFGHRKLQNTLWQTVSAPDAAFHIHFIPKTRQQSELQAQKQQLLKLYTRDYQALEQFFGNRPPAPHGIDIWLYPDRNVKAQFIGAKNTSFARVWLNEIHLVQTSPDATLAKHEMAHLFAAQFGNGPLKLAGGWNIPALGWIEGLAMAAEWPILQKFDLHQWSAAILARPKTFGHITPHALIYGFWGLPSRVAYTLAGSYVQYLITHYGIERVKLLSKAMPGDFSDIIGVDFHEAFDAWKAWLQIHHTVPKALHTVDLVFGSASIWNKQCARAQAAQKSSFYQCLSDMTCPDLKSVQLGNCKESQAFSLPWESSNAPKFKLSWDEAWALYQTLGPLAHRRMPHTWSIMAQSPYFAAFKPTLQNFFKTQGFSETPLYSSCPALTLDLVSHQDSVDILRVFLASEMLQHASNGSRAAQIQGLERLGDILWHSDQNTLAYIIYTTITRWKLPENTARRIEIKQNAVQYPLTLEAYAVRRWFAATSLDEQLQLAVTYRRIPIIAYLAFVHYVHRNEMPEAQNALMNLLMFHQNAAQGSALSPKIWAETLRLMPLLCP